MKYFLKTLFVVTLFVCSISFSVNNVSASELYRDSVLLAYRPNSSILMVDYKNNKQELDKVYSFIKNNVNKLQQNLSHINIVSYIYKNQIGNLEAINNACIQASVVRALFKSKYDIPHSAITFSIDTAQNISNVVRVDYVSASVPLYSNNAIYYSEGGSIGAIESMLSKYTQGIPYTNYWMHVARMNPSLLGLGDISSMSTVGSLKSNEVNSNAVVGQSIIFTPSEPVESEPISNDDDISGVIAGVIGASAGTDAANTVSTPKIEESTDNKELKHVAEDSKTKEAHVLYNYGRQIFGLKTNLLYWAVAVPNLEMEFYLGKMVSLQFEGAYTWGGFVLPADKSYYIWNAGAEVRIWLNNDAKFNGHFFGVYGGAGQYDLKFGQIGSQGDYYGAGITYGYMLPIKRRFHMEFSIGGGWANYSKLNYEHFKGLNYEVSKEDNLNYFGITKAKVSLVWKF